MNIHTTGVGAERGLPSLFVILDRDGSILKVIKMHSNGSPFTGTVTGVAIAGEQIWTCKDDTTIASFSKQDVMQTLSSGSVYGAAVHLVKEVRVAVSPYSLCYDARHELLWVGEMKEPTKQDKGKDGKAIAYGVGVTGELFASFDSPDPRVLAEIVYGPDVRGEFSAIWCSTLLAPLACRTWENNQDGLYA
jgi:hypothetical protein